MLQTKKSPHAAGLGGGVDYSDWVWIKFWLIVAAAFVYGFWRGLTGRPLEQEADGTGQAASTGRQLKG